MSSKAAKRKKEYEQRQVKREQERRRLERLMYAKAHGSMEDTAEAMGIKLR